MVLKFEMIPDQGLGPGHALLRISGQGAVSPEVWIQIERNQENEKILGPNQHWTTEDVWHPLTLGQVDGQSVVFPLGPDLVDPMAEQSHKVAFLVSAKMGEESGRIRLTNFKMQPSYAAGVRAAPVAEPVPEPLLPEEVPVVVEPPPNRPPVSEEPKSPLMVLVATGVGLLVAAGVGAGVYFAFFAEKKAEKPPEVVAAPAVPILPPAPASPSMGTLPEVDTFLKTVPDAKVALEEARKLAEGGKPDLSMLIYRYAARTGNPQAALALGRMYDSETWSAKTSPLPQADDETAAYWYEIAVQGNTAEAQRLLGKVMVRRESSGPGREKGLAWLKKAADAGDAEAKAVLEKLK